MKRLTQWQVFSHDGRPVRVFSHRNRPLAQSTANQIGGFVRMVKVRVSREAGKR